MPTHANCAPLGRDCSCRYISDLADLAVQQPHRWRWCQCQPSGPVKRHSRVGVGVGEFNGSLLSAEALGGEPDACYDEPVRPVVLSLSGDWPSEGYRQVV